MGPAEAKGFEPPRLLHPAVFKTVYPTNGSASRDYIAYSFPAGPDSLAVPSSGYDVVRGHYENRTRPLQFCRLPLTSSKLNGQAVKAALGSFPDSAGAPRLLSESVTFTSGEPRNRTGLGCDTLASLAVRLLNRSLILQCRVPRLLASLTPHRSDHKWP